MISLTNVNLQSITAYAVENALNNSRGYSIDNTNHTITVYPKGNETDSINAALRYLAQRQNKTIKWTLYLDSGEYLINKPLAIDNLENVLITSLSNNAAVVKKSPTFSGEYLLYIRFSRNIALNNLKLAGKTQVFNSKKPAWGEQGVYFGSCKNITVSNCYFHDFGDAALKIATSPSDSVKGINSSDIQVLNNHFDNFMQISTTTARGGSYNYLFKGNKLTNLHGSLKFATRMEGAAKVKITDNSITNSYNNGIEIVGYSDVVIANNVFKNIKNFTINCYTNDKAPKGFQWGDNITIKDNQVYNTRRGIRFSPNPYPDGYIPFPNNFIVVGNLFNGINDSSAPVISIVNGSINGVLIANNKIKNFNGKNWVYTDKNCKKVTLKNNS